MKELVSPDDATKEVEALQAAAHSYVESPADPAAVACPGQQLPAGTRRENDGRVATEELVERIALLERTVEDYERELANKANALRTVIDELAKRNPGAGHRHIDDRTILGAEPAAENALAKSAPGGRVTRLLVGHCGGRELQFPLFKNRLTIGRTRDNDVRLSAAHVSRRHAVVVTDCGQTRIVDWGSKNGVYVNCRRVTEHFLNCGDKIRIGSFEFRYRELVPRAVS